MSRINKANQLLRRKYRIRKRIYGTSERPRMTIYISNRQVSVQIIDDEKQNTLVYSSTVGTKYDGKTMTEMASEMGKDIAQKAKKKKIAKVVLDRNGRIYHGRIKALAESAREAGLEF